MILNPGGKVLPNLDALAFGEQTSLPAEGRTDPAYYEAIADAIAQRTAEGGITLVPLSVTANGSYTPESGQAYSGVTVAVPTGGGLEILVTAPTGSVVTASKDGSSYSGAEDAQNPGHYTVTVPEAGTYTVTAVYNVYIFTQSVNIAQSEVIFETIEATIYVSAANGAEITVAFNGNVVNTLTGTGTAVPVTVYAKGDYTVSASFGASADSTTITISEDGQEEYILLSAVPQGYEKVAFIQSSGTQYIDTELSMPSGFLADMNISFTASPAGKILIGSRASSGENRNFIGVTSDGIWNVGLGASYFRGGTPNVGVKYSVVGNTISIPTGSTSYDNLTINGNAMTLTKGNTGTASHGSNNSLCIFAVGQGGSAAAFASCAVYDHFAVYSDVDKENAVANFVPSRRQSDGEYGMYDTVRGRFFANAGSGSFTGPEVS